MVPSSVCWAQLKCLSTESACLLVPDVPEKHKHQRQATRLTDLSRGAEVLQENSWTTEDVA